MGGKCDVVSERAKGHPWSSAEILPAVYQDLRKIAAYRLAHERDGHLLQATELLDEAWLRVCGTSLSEWDNERHFFASICRAMRRILVEQARRRQRAVSIDDSEMARADQLAVACSLPDEELLAVDEAMIELSNEDPEAAELVDLRFFGGLTQSQAAEKLGISRSSADRLWVFARAWLAHRIRDSRDFHSG